jgi:hypothetical protein
MAKYITFEELQGARLGLHQFPGTVGKHRLEVVSEKPGTIQVKGHTTQGHPTKIVTVTPGQTLAYSGGDIWIVRPYTGPDPIRKWLNERKLPKDFIEWVDASEIKQEDDFSEARLLPNSYGRIVSSYGRFWKTNWKSKRLNGGVAFMDMEACYDKEVNSCVSNAEKIRVAKGTAIELVLEALDSISVRYPESVQAAKYEGPEWQD